MKECAVCNDLVFHWRCTIFRFGRLCGSPRNCSSSKGFGTKPGEKTTGFCKQYRQCMSIDAVMASQAERPMQPVCVHTPPGGLRTAQAKTAGEEALKFVCYFTSLYTLELPRWTHKVQQPCMRMYVACILTMYRLLCL